MTVIMSTGFWRDLRYALGALSAGFIADPFGFAAAIASIAALTFLSGTSLWRCGSKGAGVPFSTRIIDPSQMVAAAKL